MSRSKRYFWIKLTEDFMHGNEMTYIMMQPNGTQCVVIYHMLCLKSVNAEGRLVLRFGEREVPFTRGMLVRELRWFTEEEIEAALALLEEVGLITRENDVFVISNYAELAGSETGWSAEKRTARRKKQSLASATPTETAAHDRGHSCGQKRGQNAEIVRIDIEQDTELDTDTELDIDTEQDTELETDKDRARENTNTRETRPALPDELKDYVSERLTGVSNDLLAQFASFRPKLSDELLRRAADLAVERGRPRLIYACGILRQWVKNGVSGVDDVQSSPDAYRKPVQYGSGKILS